MKPKVHWKAFAVFVVLGVILVVVGIMLLVENNRYGSVAFGLLGAMSAGVSLFMLIGWSRRA
ncbi:hypothetical protein [Cryobacterium sp. Hz9]|uniref:hypothetical protein n=1 Tax=Cryobacterium sp. Hz9 TaxID=1259167 RepID=UPI00106AF082|nr:hypothetical protein [Cryobacterium sp. Hz9]TFB69034.1 hypothetical protein E3N85_04260 [Cryobacterium sp. Hz9]